MIRMTLTAAHTSGVLAICGGRTYFRAPIAPTGRVLFLDVDTCEPLLVPTGQGWQLPTFEIFATLLASNMVELDADLPNASPFDEREAPAPRREPEALRAAARQDAAPGRRTYGSADPRRRRAGIPLEERRLRRR